MKTWIAKAIVQKTISYLPFSHQINFWFQKNITKGVYLSDDYFTDRMQHAVAHLSSYKQYRDTQDMKCLELGTGWYPVVPLIYYLVGADHVTTIDASRLLDCARLQTTLDKMVAKLSTVADALQKVGFSIDKNRMELLKTAQSSNISKESLNEVLRKLDIQYVVGDARKMDVPSDYYGLISSNNTFEHVYPNVLKDILKEFERVLKSGGVQSHFIDMSDHFAHFDQSISHLHFLRFSDSQWKWIDNSMQPMNRLRLDDYLNMYHEFGIEVLAVTPWMDNNFNRKETPLNSRFQNKTDEVLSTTHAYITSR